MRFMRQREVLRLTGLSRSTLSRLEKTGQFPKRRTLSPAAVAWSEEEVLLWAKSRVSRTDTVNVDER
jgi:prophage regulatory protein